MKLPALVAGLAAMLATSAVPAIEFKPKVEAEGRWFFQYDPDGQPLLGAAAGTVEIFHGWDDNKQRIVGELFQRYDENDDARTHGDVRELYYQVIGDDFEFRLGARRVFWGVTESRHLVDVINQSDFVENIDNEDKLGQPMMNVAFIRDIGTFEVFLLPYQRARTFPGAEGFPRLPLPVHAHEALYQSQREQTHLDGALRYVGSFGPLDIGIAWFDGTAREPRLLVCLPTGARGQFFTASPDGPTCGEDEIRATANDPPPLPPPDYAQQVEAEIRSSLVLVPYYDRLQQASVDAQYVIGSLAVKLEALHRTQHGVDTWAAVTGFEYTLGDVQGSGADIGLLAEYLYDEKDDFLGQLADDELFVGSRVALNDVAGTQFLGGMIASRKDFRNRLYGVEASRRLGDDWKLSVESRLFSAMPDDLVGQTLSNQDFVMLTLERFF